VLPGLALPVLYGERWTVMEASEAYLTAILDPEGPSLDNLDGLIGTSLSAQAATSTAIIEEEVLSSPRQMECLVRKSPRQRGFGLLDEISLLASLNGLYDHIDILLRPGYLFLNESAIA
jgi:hypothetical protein